VSDWDPSRTDIDLFRAGIEPLVAADRLGVDMVQFPQSFHHGLEALDYLDWLLAAFAPYPTAVELRHKSWSDHAAETQARLLAHRAAWVLIDEPKFSSSIVQAVGGLSALPPGAPPVAYLRLHGRNAAAWWEHAVADDRYNYLYSAEELQPFAERARVEAAVGRKVFLYLNNHFSAKAVANAAVLQRQVGQSLRGEYSLAFRMAYGDVFP
jgi:uncharacterized protein YecE (DUF72 family)